MRIYGDEIELDDEDIELAIKLHYIEPDQIETHKIDAEINDKQEQFII